MEVADRDDPVEEYNDWVVQLCHDGRLLLQVLGYIRVLDLVKCSHLQSHLLAQNDVNGHLQKGCRGQLVVAN